MCVRKITQTKIPKSKHTTKEILEYILSELWGSSSTPESLGGCKYFLKTKEEAFEKLRDWKEAVQNHTGKRIKCLQTDNGLEFCNYKFDNLCKSFGISRHCIFHLYTGNNEHDYYGQGNENVG